MSLKVRLGKLDSARKLDSTWHDSLARPQATGLDVSVTHALRAGRLDWDHRDPFDRLLVAQAQAESLALVTADRAMLSAPDIEIVPW